VSFKLPFHLLHLFGFGISSQAVGIAYPLLSPLALRAIGRQVMYESPLTRDRTSQFPLYAHTELFGDSFCPPGRLCGCSVLPASGAGSFTSDWGVVFMVFTVSLKSSVYRRVSNLFYHPTSSLSIILVMGF
jgi:hypothetical protein